MPLRQSLGHTAVRSGAFDDWEGPAERLALDDDRVPERASQDDPEAAG
jgi:nitrogen fixation-related uncharacterized protein